MGTNLKPGFYRNGVPIDAHAAMMGTFDNVTYVLEDDANIYNLGMFDDLKNIVCFDLTHVKNLTRCPHFNGCNALKDVYLPASVKYIDTASSFADIFNLKNVYIEEGNEFYKDIDGVVYSKNEKELILVPSGKKNIIFSPELMIIRQFAFTYVDIEYLRVPSTVIVVQKDAFTNAYIDTLVLPSSVENFNESCASVFESNKMGSIKTLMYFGDSKQVIDNFETQRISYIHKPFAEEIEKLIDFETLPLTEVNALLSLTKDKGYETESKRAKKAELYLKASIEDEHWRVNRFPYKHFGLNGDFRVTRKLTQPIIIRVANSKIFFGPTLEDEKLEVYIDSNKNLRISKNPSEKFRITPFNLNCIGNTVINTETTVKLGDEVYLYSIKGVGNALGRVNAVLSKKISKNEFIDLYFEERFFNYYTEYYQDKKSEGSLPGLILLDENLQEEIRLYDEIDITKIEVEIKAVKVKELEKEKDINTDDNFDIQK